VGFVGATQETTGHALRNGLYRQLVGRKAATQTERRARHDTKSGLIQWFASWTKTTLAFPSQEGDVNGDPHLEEIALLERPGKVGRRRTVEWCRVTSGDATTLKKAATVADNI